MQTFNGKSWLEAIANDHAFISGQYARYQRIACIRNVIYGVVSVVATQVTLFAAVWLTGKSMLSVGQYVIPGAAVIFGGLFPFIALTIPGFPLRGDHFNRLQAHGRAFLELHALYAQALDRQVPVDFGEDKDRPHETLNSLAGLINTGTFERVNASDYSYTLAIARHQIRVLQRALAVQRG